MIKHLVAKRDQKGLASLVTVFVLIILLTLISLGFARLMNRSTTNSTNRQLGDVATYAAQSGINDVVDYMKTFANDPANAANPYVASPDCTGRQSLIGSADQKGPFYNDSDLSTDGSRNAQYSCILLNQTPTDLAYQNIPEYQSQVTKVNTSAVTGALNSVMLSWQPSGSPTNSPNYPSHTPQLLDETTWNDASHSYMPLLRVTIYPIPASGSVANLQQNSKTFFLYPLAPDGNTTVQSQSYASIGDGQLLTPVCGRTKTGVSAGFTGTADYRCNYIISGLTNSVSSPSTDPINDFYIRLTPIYGSLDVELQANDIDNQQLKFIGDQAIVDVTAEVANVSKRLQARVDISNEISGSSSDDISPDADGIPEFSVRTPDALCKQITLHHNLFDYVTFDDSAVCNTSGTVTNTPAPQLAFTITGHSDRDNGLTVDSESNNPDTPQDPVQKGTVYIGAGGNTTLNWNANDVTDCEASSTDNSFTGNVLVAPYNTTTTVGRDDTTSIGSWTTPSIDTIQTYNLGCTGPGSASGTPLKKSVTAWPPPTVTLTVTPDGGTSTVETGESYTVNWTSTNSIKCSLSGDWPSTSTATSGSEDISWSQADTQNPNYSKTFNADCTDPIGRDDPQTVTVSTNSTGTPGSPGSPGSPNPPDVGTSACHASVTTSGNSTANATITWSTGCDYYDDVNWWEGDRYITTNVPGVPDGLASPGYFGSGSVRITTDGTYCMDVEAWEDFWTSKSDADAAGPTGNGAANSGNVCISVHEPIVGLDLRSPSGIWDQWPECAAGSIWWNGSNEIHPASEPATPVDTWWCRGNSSRTQTYPNGDDMCADGVHRWTMCDITWTSSAGGETGDITCKISERSDVNDVFLSGLGASGTRSSGWGWGGEDGGGNPNDFILTCSTPWVSQSASFSLYIN